MAFIPHTLNEGGHPPFEYLPAKAGDVALGMALDFTGGKVVKISAGTTVPKYFSLVTKTCADGEIIPVQKLETGVDYETTSEATLSEGDVGKKVALNTNGLQVTSNATDGVAQIVSVDGKKVVVRF
jgi:hypothetical protein